MLVGGNRGAKRVPTSLRSTPAPTRGAGRDIERGSRRGTGRVVGQGSRRGGGRRSRGSGQEGGEIDTWFLTVLEGGRPARYILPEAHGQLRQPFSDFPGYHGEVIFDNL